MTVREVFPVRLPAAALFDLDGTLVDSAPDLAVAVNRLLSADGFAPVSDSAVRLWVGNGARKLVERALTHAGSQSGRAFVPDDAIIDDALARFLDYYADCCTFATRPYQGVQELLRHWAEKGVKLAVVTNKPTRFTHLILEKLELAAYFDVVTCGDSYAQKKPDPMPLRETLGLLGVAADAALMIGDSRADLLAARAAGVPCVCVSYGYHQGVDLRALEADMYIDCLSSLCQLR